MFSRTVRRPSFNEAVVWLRDRASKTISVGQYPTDVLMALVLYAEAKRARTLEKEVIELRKRVKDSIL